VTDRLSPTPCGAWTPSATRPRWFGLGKDFADAPDYAALDGVHGLPEGGLRACNVGSGEPHTVGEMAAALAASHGDRAPVATGEFRLGDVRHITAPSQRLREELGWKPQVTFAEGMAEFVAAPLRAG
jgi:dTDP-L-rhamnose 4-epimerase